MERETLTTLLVLLFGATSCLVLHILIGVGQRRSVRRHLSRTGEENHSLKPLLLAWIGHALRTTVWLLFATLVVTLMPRTRTQVETVGTRLQRQGENILEWIVEHGLNLIIIAAITIFIMRFTAALIQTIFIFMKRSASMRDEAATQRRLKTLSTIFSGVIQSAVLFIGIVTLLQQLRVNVTPILASAGVVGIAIGFGAQSLIKDLFSGFLILLEDQFSVDDTVKIGEYTGTVEQITLRATRVRGIDGSLTIIPNGEISTVSNLSKDWSRAVIDVEIDYSENVDRAMKIVLDAASRLRAELPHQIIEEPKMLGVEKLGYSGVVLKMTVKTAPAKQFDIARDLRRQIKLALDSHGVKMPLAKQQLLMPEELASAVTESRKGTTEAIGAV